MFIHHQKTTVIRILKIACAVLLVFLLSACGYENNSQTDSIVLETTTKETSETEETIDDSSAEGETSVTGNTDEEPEMRPTMESTAEQIVSQEESMIQEAEDALLETGEDYVAMELDVMDRWAEDWDLVKHTEENLVVYEPSGTTDSAAADASDEDSNGGSNTPSGAPSLSITLNDAGNCVELIGTAVGTGEEQADFYESYGEFMLTGEIYGRFETVLNALRTAVNPADLSETSRSDKDDGVTITLQGNADGTTTLTIYRPSGGPFIEF